MVLTREEVKKVLSPLQGLDHLFLTLWYGTGMRLMEGLRLRVKDIEFTGNQITIRDGKGATDRMTMLPAALKPSLQRHLEEVRTLHRADLEAGYGQVYLPYALNRKYTAGLREWGWQYVFPATVLSVDPRSGVRRRHHLDERVFQKAFREAVKVAGVGKPRDVSHPPPLLCDPPVAGWV